MIRDGVKAAAHQAKERISREMLASFGCNNRHGNPRPVQTWPRHPCQQWGLKTTGCARVPDRVLTSRTRLGMLCCITYCSVILPLQRVVTVAIVNRLDGLSTLARPCA